MGERVAKRNQVFDLLSNGHNARATGPKFFPSIGPGCREATDHRRRPLMPRTFYRTAIDQSLVDSTSVARAGFRQLEPKTPCTTPFPADRAKPPMFQRKRILVVGSDKIAIKICDELVADGRPVSQVESLNRAAPYLRSTQTLVLADLAGNPDELVQQVAALCRTRPARHRPLRLILVRNGGEISGSPLTIPGGSHLPVETFDPEAEAARALLARWPPHSEMDPPYGQVPHILFAGLAAPAPALLVQTLRLFHYGDAQPVITLADEDPEALREQVLAAYPQAGQFCRLRFIDLEDTGLGDAPPVTGAFVCLTSPDQGLTTARNLALAIARAQRVTPLIHLEIGDTIPAAGPGDWDGQLVPFSWLHEACNPKVLLDGRGDELARVIHEHYRDSIAAQGRDPDAEPAGRSWERLDTSYRNASRHQADHLQAKLAILDCRAVREELVESFTFAPLEAERLAVVEHKRWAADRYLDGWTYAPERNNARKQHPQLIPYDDLSEPMKDLDRFAGRLAPTLLARSGRGLVRMLVVAVVEPQVGCRTDRRLERLADQALRRLVGRYPDRSLVLASTLESEASRRVVHRAVYEFEAGLFLLCPRPLPEVLSAQPGEQARGDLLALAARAERRICLPGAREPERWFARRAEIRLILGRDPEAEKPGKQVRLDPARGLPDWSFEY